MAIWHYLQRNIFNFYLEVRHWRRQLVCCLIFLLVGIVVGCFLHGGTNFTLWHTNRENYVIIIVHSGSFFSVLFTTIFKAAIYALMLFLLSFFRWINNLKCIIPFISGLYLGIYLCIAVEMFGLLGFVYFLLVFLVESLLVTLAVIFSYCDCDNLCPFGRSLASNVFFCNKRAFIVLALGCLVKILTVFLILRIFTAFI